MALLLCNTRITHASPHVLRKLRKHIMSESILTPLHNARQISQCVPELLKSGIPARCTGCSVARCRSQLLRETKLLTTGERCRSR